jgi:hypothetical protein
MSAIILLILRILMAIVLYAFLGFVLFTIWRDLKSQASRSIARQIIPLHLSFSTEAGSQELRFMKTNFVLGRDSGCDCLIQDKTISNRHARLSFHHQQWWLDDLGSTNGTFLNQEPVTSSVVVTSGDQITCGKVEIVVHLEEQIP